MATWQGLGTGDWSDSANWQAGALPNAGTDAFISSGNAIITSSEAASNVVLSDGKTVEVSAGGALNVTTNFVIYAGSALIVRDGGAVSATLFTVRGSLIVGGISSADFPGDAQGLVLLDGAGAGLVFNSLTDLTFSNDINGSGLIYKQAASRVTLTGANSYSGHTFINGGVLNIQHASALGTTTGGTTVAAGAALELQSGNSIFFGAETLTLNGTGVLNGGALRNISGNNTWTGATITLGSASRINSDAGDLAVWANIIGAEQSLTLGGPGNTAMIGPITTGGGSLTKDGAGFVNLAGTNTYTGVTTINDGILGLVHGKAIADTGAVVVNAPGHLSVASSETIGSLAGSGTVTLMDGQTLIIGGNGASTSFSGRFRDNNGASPGNIVKIGAGTLTLSGASSFYGETYIHEGVINLQHPDALGLTYRGNLVNTGAALELQGGINFHWEFLSLNGTGVANGGALRSISGNNVWSGPIDLGSAVRINSDADQLTISGGITVYSGVGQDLTVGGSGTVLISDATSWIDGVITIGAGSLTKDGTGTLILTGTNTYTGQTNVTEGTLAMQGDGILAGGTHLSVAAGATFDIAGVSRTTFTLGNGIINNGTVNLDGKTLVVNNAAAFATSSGAYNGSAGIDALVFNVVGANFNISTSSTANFTNWTDGVDTVTINGTSITNDWLTGTSRGDTLNGNSGYDTLIGGAGTDHMTGGPLLDVFYFTASDLQSGVRDTITDHEGDNRDLIRIDGVQYSAVNVASAAGGVLVTVNGAEILVQGLPDTAPLYVATNPTVVDPASLLSTPNASQLTSFDWAGNLPYSQFTEFYGSAGRERQMGSYDSGPSAGGRWDFVYDAANATTQYAQRLDYLNAAGQMVEQRVILDGTGGYTIQRWDRAGTESYDNTIAHYSQSGQVNWVQSFYDASAGGGSGITNFDPANAQNYSSYTDLYTSTGQLEQEFGSYDGGPNTGGRWDFLFDVGVDFHLKLSHFWG